MAFSVFADNRRAESYTRDTHDDSIDGDSIPDESLVVTSTLYVNYAPDMKQTDFVATPREANAYITELSKLMDTAPESWPVERITVHVK